MRTRRISLVLVFVLFLLPLEGWAHEHRAMFAVGVRDTERSDLWGLALGYDKALREKCNPEDAGKKCVAPFSLFVGFSHVRGSHEGANKAA